MKKLVILALGACALASAVAQTNVGVSIGINQPGVYGRIDIGNYPQPRLVYPQPVVIMQTPIAVHQQPIYLYVPPGHQKNWAKHCARYNACGQPVYFVQNSWYDQQYVPRYRENHGGDHHDQHHGHDKGDKHEKGHGNGKGDQND